MIVEVKCRYSCDIRRAVFQKKTPLIVAIREASMLIPKRHTINNGWILENEPYKCLKKWLNAG
jgi:hypothetical protein